MHGFLARKSHKNVFLFEESNHSEIVKLKKKTGNCFVDKNVNLCNFPDFFLPNC